MLSHNITIIKVLCSWIVILMFFGLSEAQTQDLKNLKFDNLTSENIKIEKGLSQNTIHCILQDR